MYKILALNCLITAYSLSVQYLDGIKFGDYQITITGMMMSVCFLCISRAKVSLLSSRRTRSGSGNGPPCSYVLQLGERVSADI
jgi:magnesium-transporting ATPase (P-type)